MTTTPVALLGPALWTTRTYQKALLTWKAGRMKKSSGIAYFWIDRSADPPVAPTTCVVADAELLAALGSGSVALTVALLVMEPAVAGVVALIVIVALAPDASEPTLHVTVLPVMVQPELAEGEVTPAGRVSVTTTP